MGCDGGTIPKRHELVKGPRKVEKVRGRGIREGWGAAGRGRSGPGALCYCGAGGGSGRGPVCCGGT